jgi:hypothetical protein
VRRGAFKRYALGSLVVVAAIALCASLTVAVTSGASRRPGERPPVRTAAASRIRSRGVDVGFLAQSVSFVSDDEGFVLGAVQCGQGWCAAVRRTFDRGAIWSSVRPPPATIDSTLPGSIERLRFANPADGFAFGPGLWETQDAGSTWQGVSLPGPIAALAVSNRMAYAVVDARCVNGGQCAPGMLFESALGAGTWHSVPGVSLPGMNVAGAGSDVANVAAYIAVAGDAVYVAAGDAFVGSTTGARFHDVRSPCSAGPGAPPPSGHAITAIAASASRLAVLCGDGVATGPQTAFVYVSSDGGVNYRQLSVPSAGGDNRALAVSGPTTVFVTAVSGESAVYRTAGPDTSWTTPASFSDGGLGIGDLSFVTPADGAFIHGTGVVGQAETLMSSRMPTRIAGRVGALYLTDDGGSTWSEDPVRV